MFSLMVLAAALGGAPAAYAAAPPANGTPPTVTGNATVGATLQASPGQWSGDPQPTYTYRWQYRTSTGTWPDIAGATGASYVIAPSDVGNPLRVNVTATNSAGSAEQVSNASAAVTQAPPNPPAPPAPPNDALGTPNNSRVLSADGLQISHLNDGDKNPLAQRSYTTAATTGTTGDLTSTPDFTTDGKHEDNFGRTLLPASPTARGRFGDQNTDGVLSASYGQQDTTTKNHYLVVNPNSETARSSGTEWRPVYYGVPAGQWIMLSLGLGHDHPELPLQEVPTPVTGDDGTGNSATTNVILFSDRANWTQDPGSAAWWYTMPDPGGSSYVQLSNRVTGLCLTVRAAHQNVPVGTLGGTVTAEPCATGTVPDRQLWAIPPAYGKNFPDAFAVRSKTGAYLREGGCQSCNAVPQLVADVPPDAFNVWMAKNSLGPQGSTGGSVPTWSSAQVGSTSAAALLASGDLDRATDVKGTYHDEAAVVYPQADGTSTLSVLNYAAPLDRVNATSLALTLPQLDHPLGVTIGDYNGDGLDEIAVLWADRSGTSRVTFYTYRADKAGNRVLAPSPAATVAVPNFTYGPHVTVRSADLDGDGRDDLAIASPSKIPLVVVSFTSSLGIRGTAGKMITGGRPFQTNSDRGIEMQPGLFRFDPEAGYTLQRRQLALAWSEQPAGTTTYTLASVFSVDFDPATCTVDVCPLTINEYTPRDRAHIVIQTWGWPGNAQPNMPLSLAVGGLQGTSPAGKTVKTWGMALTINDSAPGTPQRPFLYMLGVANHDVSVLSKNALPTEPQYRDGTYPNDYYPVTAVDLTGGSTVVGAPVILHADNLLTPTLLAAQAPSHADWFPQLNGGKGAFYNVSRYGNFSVTLGSTSTTQYEHTYTSKDGWNVGVSGSVTVAGTASENVLIADATESLKVKVEASYLHQATEGRLSKYSTSFSTTVSQRGEDDDLVQGKFQSYTVYRYPLLGGALKNDDGTAYTDPACKTACYGFYEATVPGPIVPIEAVGRNVAGYNPSWENGNALSYPQLNTSAAAVPTPDLGPYTYRDDAGTTQSIDGPLFNTQIGVGGADTSTNFQVTSETGNGHSSETQNTWEAGVQVTAKSAWWATVGAASANGSVKVQVGVKGGQDFVSDDAGQNLTSSGSSFSMEVPSIDDNKSYQIGTAYYYDKAGTARVSMADDLTTDRNGSAWWKDNYSTPDPALNLPNATFTSTDQFNHRVNVSFNTTDVAQAIRGFQVIHPSTATTAGAPFTSNPVAGEPVEFTVPIHNYSLNPVSNVPVSFYAVPIGPNANGVDVPVGTPQPIGATTIPRIAARGVQTVAPPAWTAKTLPGDTGVRAWHIFVVIDPKGTIANDTHPWKDTNGPCPASALDPGAPKGTVINGVMVDPMTGKASTLACGQDNQGWGAVSVSPAADRTVALRTAAATGERVLDLAAAVAASNTVSANTAGVSLDGSGVITNNRSNLQMGAHEVATIRLGQQFTGIGYVGADRDSVQHQPVVVYDGPPSDGNVVAVTTLDGVTAAGGNQARFNWRPTTAGLHHIYLKLLGTQQAGPGAQTSFDLNVVAPTGGQKPPPTGSPSTSSAPTKSRPSSPTAASSTTLPTTSMGPSPWPAQSGGEIAYTGAGSVGRLVAIGVALILTGAALSVAQRRRS